MEEEDMKPDRDISLAEEEIAFYFEIGKALSQWANIESQLRKLVGKCVSMGDAVTVERGFLAIENFRSKLDYCDALVSRKFGKSMHFGRWVTLVKRIKASQVTRNQIAHNKPVLFIDGEASRRWAVVQWTREKHGTHDASKAPPGAMCLINVIQTRREFHAITTALANLQCALLGKTEPFEASLELANDPPTIRPTRNQIRGALGLQLLPSLKKPQPKVQS